MSTRLGRSPPRGAEGGRALPAALLGALLFAAAFGLLHLPPWSGHEIVDTPVYQRYGDAVVGGAVPYRDFELEYPPGALPAFVLPSLAAEGDYRTVFELLMLACGAGAAALVALTLARVGAAPARVYGGAALAGLAPLALGSVLLTRFDLWPALLVAAALAALAGGRPRLGLGLLGAAAAAKLYPAVVLPLALVHVARRHGRRAALESLLAFVAVVACAVLPFALLSPEGLWASVERQTGRPLQIESLGAAVLLAARQLGTYEPEVVSSFGSQNLAGGLPDALATVHTAVQALLLVGLWLAFAARRRPSADPAVLLAAAAAAVAIFLAFGKVLSPQFAIWLLPLVPLVLGGAGIAAAVLLVAALVLTQLWFPTRYWDLVAFDAYAVWLLVARDAVLVALAALLAAATVRARAGSRSG